MKVFRLNSVREILERHLSLWMSQADFKDVQKQVKKSKGRRKMKPENGKSSGNDGKRGLYQNGKTHCVQNDRKVICSKLKRDVSFGTKPFFKERIFLILMERLRRKLITHCDIIDLTN